MIAPAPAKPATRSRVLWAAWDAPVADNVFTLCGVDGRGKETRARYRFARLLDNQWLLGWSVAKEGGPTHHVRLEGRFVSCDCPAADFDKQRTGGCCKHLQSLYLLRVTGLPTDAAREIERHLLAHKGDS